MSCDFAITVDQVSKCYQMYARPEDRLKQALSRWKKRYFREFWALRDASFSVRRGESVGIIGCNGSGKSTLLQIIAGTLTPTTGQVEVRGRVGALLELGSGFNPKFTGRENVYLNGAILGLSRRDMDKRFDEIASFADIGQFIDQPVMTYSSGMLVRLAFAVQVQVEPDILIVDEALSVGDNLFQKRCFQRLHQLIDQGVTLLFVSHAQEAIRTLTSRVVLLHEGRIKCIGEPGEVLLDYRRLLHEEEKRWLGSRVKLAEQARSQLPPPDGTGHDESPDDDKSFGDLDAEVLDVHVLDESGGACTVFEPGQPVVIRIRVRVNRPMEHLNVALRIRDKQGVKIYSWGTLNQDIAIWAGQVDGPTLWDRSFEAGRVLEVDFHWTCRLGRNFYEVQAAVTEEQDRHYTDQRTLHWRDEAAFFQVMVDKNEYFFGGICDLCMSATVREQCPASA